MGKMKRFFNRQSAAVPAADTRQQLQMKYTEACAEEGHLRFVQRSTEKRLRELDGIREDLQRRLDAVDAREKQEAAKKAEAQLRTNPEGLPTSPGEVAAPEAQV